MCCRIKGKLFSVLSCNHHNTKLDIGLSHWKVMFLNPWTGKCQQNNSWLISRTEWSTSVTLNEVHNIIARFTLGHQTWATFLLIHQQRWIHWFNITAHYYNYGWSHELARSSKSCVLAPKEKILVWSYIKSFIGQACSVKMAGLDSFFAAFLLTLLNFVFVHKKTHK